MAYPTSLDELTDGVPSDVDAPSTAMNDATYPHDDHHRALAVAVEAVEAELGTDPSGSEATVKARIAATEAVANAAAAKASNLSDLTSAATARTNLGLGGAATLAVGTTAGTVAAGDDSRITGAVPKSTVTTAGDLIYATGAAAVARLGIGSALQVLRTNAGATAPEWATVSSGAVSVIACTVLASPAASVDFTSIPATYESLMVMWQAKSSGTGAATPRMYTQFNGDTGSNYGYSNHFQSGASGGSVLRSSAGAARMENYMLDSHASVTSGFAAGGRFDIPSYARTTFVKQMVGVYEARYGLGDTAVTVHFGGKWNSTAAINQITFAPETGNFVAGTVFTLYGIAGA